MAGRVTSFADHKTLCDLLCALFALALLGAALKLRARPRLSALLISLTGVLVGLAMSADDFLHKWDERYHALVALHLSWHPLLPTLYEAQPLPLSQDWLHGGVWLHKPPLPLWLMAGFLKLFGRSELCIRLPSVLLHGAAAYATARLGKLLFEDDRAGLLACLLVAINGQLLDLASGRRATDHPDSMLASLTCLSIWAALADKPTRAGLLTGLAVLTKWLIGLLPFAVWFVHKRDWKRLLLAFVVCVAVAAPWTLYTSHAFPEAHARETHERLLHLTTVVEEHGGGWWFHLVRTPRFFGEASPLALVFFFWRRRGTPAWAPLLAWIALPYAFFSLVPTRMENYPLLAAPAFALVIAAAALDLAALRRPLATLVAAALVLLPLRYCVERWKPFQQFPEERALAAQLRALPDEGRVLIVGSQHPIETMFYKDVIAVDETPPEAVLAPLRAQGWQIVTSGP